MQDGFIENIASDKIVFRGRCVCKLLRDIFVLFHCFIYIWTNKKYSLQGGTIDS